MVGRDAGGQGGRLESESPALGGNGFAAPMRRGNGSAVGGAAARAMMLSNAHAESARARPPRSGGPFDPGAGCGLQPPLKATNHLALVREPRRVAEVVTTSSPKEDLLIPLGKNEPLR